MPTDLVCSVAGCTDARHSKGMCSSHYNRERDKLRGPRVREDRIINTRARNRALARLITLHQAEFDALFAAELTAAKVEARQVAVATGQSSPATVVRLKPGPRPADENIIDRIREDVGSCVKCHATHDGGHICGACGAPLPVVDTVRAETLARMVCTRCGQNANMRGQKCTPVPGRTFADHNFALGKAASG